MPRRKRSLCLNERRRKVRRRGEENVQEEEEEEEEDTLVISDSEHDEEEADPCPVKVTSRTSRRQDREKKTTHVPGDMTEDEMLDMALRLSEQEANSASRREQVEDADMRKAIEESLQVSNVRASEPCSKRSRPAAKPHQDRATVTARVRCKLSFTNDSDEDVSETLASLPPMPDLSQRTSSQPSPPSPILPSVPSEEVTPHSPDPTQSDAALKTSPVFLRECSVRLNPTLPITGGTPKDLPCTDDSPENAPPKSPVFPKTDAKTCTKSSRDASCTSHSAFTDEPRKTNDGDDDGAARRGDSAKSSAHVSAPGEVVKVKDESSMEKDSVPETSSPRSLEEFTSHMVLHLSDDEDDDEEENKVIPPPSPVFPQDASSRRTKLSPTQPCAASSRPENSSTFPNNSASQTSEQTGVPSKSAEAARKDPGLVSYYWGVPFCPKGQSPDDYTRVILTQLEVYEKSLKEAQRQLLHKVDWGLPVFPCPIERPHGRRLKRHRAPQLLEEEEEEERDEGRDEEEQEKQKKTTWKETKESQPRSEEDGESGHRDTYVVVSSPETQEELGKSALAFGQQEPSAKPSSTCRRPLSQERSEDTPLQLESDQHREEVQNGEFDAESTVCPETQMSEDNTPELMVTSPAQAQAENDVMEVDEATEPAAEPEERMEQEQSWRESLPSQVECPMCSRLFPLCKIEMHAAYCNGCVEEHRDHTHDQQHNPSQVSARRKSVRRTALDDDVRSEAREKCFLCEKFFERSEYTKHVDECIKQKNLGHKPGNGLLSALNKTETVHLDDSGAGPSNTALKNHHGQSDASVMRTDSQSAPYPVSSSPFKSFTPISEITDCLVDFRQQYTDRTSQRLGRKRKFKR